MTQHIIITEIGPGVYQPTPPQAAVWRDDQTVTWILGAGLQWALDEHTPPIQFKPADGDHDAWTGSPPMPVGDLPADTPDTRMYVALGNEILPLGGPQKTYHWEAWVKPLAPAGGDASAGTGSARKVTMTPNAEVDPDLVNRPLP